MKTNVKYKKIIKYLFIAFLYLSSPNIQANEDVSYIETPTAYVQPFGLSKSLSEHHHSLLGISIEMKDGWKIYWKNAGDIGLNTNIELNLPDNIQVHNILWSKPKKLASNGMVSFVLEKNLFILVEVSLKPNTAIENDEFLLQASINWLGCKNSCLPDSANIKILIPSEPVSKYENLFDSALKTIPKQHNQSLESLSSPKSFYVDIDISNTFNETDEIFFFPSLKETLPASTKQEVINIKGKRYLRIHHKILDENFTGVLTAYNSKNQPIESLQVSIKHKSKFELSFSTLLLSAFLGGLILNAMPCVLPIITLKILSFSRLAGHDRKTSMLYCLSFAFGVVLSFVILSASLIVLRSLSNNIGWGFQLQNPIFISILIAVLFLMSLSLWGVFDLGNACSSLEDKVSKSTHSPLIGSFFHGVLATLISTPCTGPFLGSAIGLSFTLSAIKNILVFTTIGIGMASPYFIIAIFPSAIKWIPKPGLWMVALKQFSGFIMAGVVIWLTWILCSQTNPLIIFPILVSMIIIAIAAWVKGSFSFSHTLSRKQRSAINYSCIVLCLIGLTLIIASVKHFDKLGQSTQQHEQSNHHKYWVKFSNTALNEHLNNGVPVLVDFTAKWCLICQTNQMTLHSTEVIEHLESLGVVGMIADLTKSDKVINSLLQDLGRNSVPAYALFLPNHKDKVILLPQTLTKKTIFDYTKRYIVNVME